MRIRHATCKERFLPCITYRSCICYGFLAAHYHFPTSLSRCRVLYTRPIQSILVCSCPLGRSEFCREESTLQRWKKAAKRVTIESFWSGSIMQEQLNHKVLLSIVQFNMCERILRKRLTTNLISKNTSYIL
jgi:hypothetical protein